MMKLKYCKVIVIALILASLLLGANVVFAGNMNNSSYLLYEGADWYMSAPLAYETVRTITYIDGLDTQMNSPSDIFVTDEGVMYIVDKNNNRIVVLENNGKLKKVIEGNDYGTISAEQYEEELKQYKQDYEKELSRINIAADKDELSATEKAKVIKIAEDKYKHYERIIASKVKKPMDKPQGIFVYGENDKNLPGHIFITDTENNRILHLDADGKFVELFHEPDSQTFDYGDRPFKPVKISVNSAYNIYTINEADYHGFTTIAPDNSFLGYIAQSKIEYSLLYNLVKWIYSKDVLEQIFPRETPQTLSNFVISQHDKLIYAVARSDNKEQIKKLTPAGNNVFPSKHYGYSATENGKQSFADYVDLAVGKTGLIYAADASTSMIDIYDQEGNNLIALGDRHNKTGGKKGTFENTSAIDIDKNQNLYVLDRMRNVIQILEPTKFMQKIFAAMELYGQGFYDEALEPWEDVLKMHNTYQHAINGIARARYGQGNYVEAMRLYKLSLNTDGYSEAFKEYRLEYFRDNFVVILVVIVLILLALIYSLVYLFKIAKKADLTYDYSDDKYGIKIFFHTLILVILHPIDAFNKLKANREKYKGWSIAAMIAVLLIVDIAYIYIVHFPLAGGKFVQWTNFLREEILFMLPLVAWVIMSFAITSISDGKTTFKETWLAALFSYMPYAIFTIPLGLLSNIMGGSEAGLYFTIKMIIVAWCAALLLLSLMNLNEYSFKQMVGNTVKIIFALACVAMIIGMIYVVINQFVAFVDEINVEILYLRNK